MYFVYPKITMKGFIRICLCFLRPFSLEKLKTNLGGFFPDKEIIFTDSGRSAFKIILDKLNLRGTEMIFPAYICDIFFDIFKQYNIKPIFVDADLETFNIKTEDIEKKITPNVKAIFVCHTYGLSVDLDRIAEIAEKHNLFLIEDCAHSFLYNADLRGWPMSYQSKSVYLGNRGNAAIFSFPKVMPIFGGGMAVLDKKFGSYNLPHKFFSWNFLFGFLKNIEVISYFYYVFRRRNHLARSRNLKRQKTIKPFWSIKILKYFSCPYR